MKKLSLVLMVVGLLALSGQSFARLCTVDAVPAATLLVPYFEVDLDDPNGVDTFFSVNNASAAPALVHVIFWTNWTIPTIDFDLYLTGYDVQTVSVRRVFEGNLPITADAPQDPADSVSPHKGPDAGDSNNPHWDDTDLVAAGLQGFPNCENFFPFGTNPIITGDIKDRLVRGHTGQTVVGNNCFGADFGDNVARGYITLDNVNQCSLELDPGNTVGTPYFQNGGTGIANNINQLWGDWFIVDGVNNFAQGDTLVHIEANDTFTGGVNEYTFYGRYTATAPPLPAGGADNREPLGTTWGTRYLNGGSFDQTQLIVWRDSTDRAIYQNGVTCGNSSAAGPEWFELNETEVVVWNEAEEAVEICFFTGGVVSPGADEDPNCFPYETARYNFGTAPLNVPFNFGWAYLNLNLPADGPWLNGVDVDFPGGLAQSYVTTIHSALNRYSVGLQAVELSDACMDPAFSNVQLTELPLAPPNDIPFFK